MGARRITMYAASRRPTAQPLPAGKRPVVRSKLHDTARCPAVKQSEKVGVTNRWGQLGRNGTGQGRSGGMRTQTKSPQPAEQLRVQTTSYGIGCFSLLHLR